MFVLGRLWVTWVHLGREQALATMDLRTGAILAQEPKQLTSFSFFFGSFVAPLVMLGHAIRFPGWAKVEVDAPRNLMSFLEAMSGMPRASAMEHVPKVVLVFESVPAVVHGVPLLEAPCTDVHCQRRSGARRLSLPLGTPAVDGGWGGGSAGLAAEGVRPAFLDGVLDADKRRPGGSVAGGSGRAHHGASAGRCVFWMRGPFRVAQASQGWFALVAPLSWCGVPTGNFTMYPCVQLSLSLECIGVDR